MFQRKALILFVILCFGTILGFISGVAPGYFLKSYALYGIGAGLLLFIFLFLIMTALIMEYLNRNQTFSTRWRIFHPRHEKLLFSFIGFILIIAGAIFGVLCELLLKAISASRAVHIIIAAIFIFILLGILIIILIVELKSTKTSQIDYHEEQPVIIQPNSRLQDGPKSITPRTNRYRTRHFDDDSRSPWQDSSFNNSTETFNTSKPPSTIQREYQKLLHPSARFYVNDKVYANDNDLARITATDDLGNYRIQYFDNGLIDFKNGSELRKALPMIN